MFDLAIQCKLKTVKEFTVQQAEKFRTELGIEKTLRALLKAALPVKGFGEDLKESLQSLSMTIVAGRDAKYVSDFIVKVGRVLNIHSVAPELVREDIVVNVLTYWKKNLFENQHSEVLAAELKKTIHEKRPSSIREFLDVLQAKAEEATDVFRRAEELGYQKNSYSQQNKKNVMKFDNNVQEKKKKKYNPTSEKQENQYRNWCCSRCGGKKICTPSVCGMPSHPDAGQGVPPFKDTAKGKAYQGLNWNHIPHHLKLAPDMKSMVKLTIDEMKLILGTHFLEEKPKSARKFKK